MSDRKSFVGVVLAGGQSSRIHTDKSQLLVKDKPLYKRAAEKIAPFCNEVYVSVNNHQSATLHFGYPVINDIYQHQGPIGGIVSCFEVLDSAMIVLACDMPLIETDDVALLISLHSTAEGCTLFFNMVDGFYDPLLSVWGIEKLNMLQKYFKGGGRSLQQFLLQNNIVKHLSPNPGHFKNINRPEDWAALSAQIL
jgi:molybdopterin-guanine dinucleotide biosynthesis protein A